MSLNTSKVDIIGLLDFNKIGYLREKACVNEPVARHLGRRPNGPMPPCRRFLNMRGCRVPTKRRSHSTFTLSQKFQF